MDLEKGSKKAKKRLMLNFLIIYKTVFNFLLQRKPAGKRGGRMAEYQGGNLNGGTKRYRGRVETV